MKINDIQNEGWTDNALGAATGKVKSAWNQSRIGSGLQAAVSDKSSVDIAAKQKFMSKFMSHITSALGSYIQSHGGAAKLLNITAPVNEMSYNDFDLLIESTISEIDAGHYDAAADVRKAKQTAANANVARQMGTTPAEVNNSPNPHEPGPANNTPDPESAPSSTPGPIASYVTALMTNSILRGIDTTDMLTQIKTIATAIEDAFKKNPKGSVSAVRSEFKKLGELAWATAGASGGNSSRSGNQTTGSTPAIGVDTNKATDLINRINSAYKTAGDLDDLRTILGAATNQYKKLGGTKETLLQAIGAVYAPKPTQQPPTTP